MNNGQRPGIVVLGAPRSGTTLLRRILDAHPSIACPGETFLFKSAARFLHGDTVSDGIDYGVLGGLSAAGVPRDETIARLREFVIGFFDEIAARDGKARWANKTAVDSFYVGDIEALFGGHVQFICIVRHGLDTACSMRDLCDANGLYIEELHRYVTQHPMPLEAFTHAWVDVTRSLIDLAARRKDDTVLIRYEDLAARPQQVVPRLFEFLGEDYDDGLLDRVFASARPQGLGDWKTFTTQSVQDSSVGRYESLSETMISRLAGIANPMLECAGYDALPIGESPDPDQALRRYEMELTLEALKANSAGED